MKGKRKLNNNRGFTLAETMMAVLIMVMVAGIVAAGMPAAMNAYQKAVLSANAQSLLSTAVNMLQDEIGTAWKIQEPESGGILYYSADPGARTLLYLDDGVLMLQEYSNGDSFFWDDRSQSNGSVGTARPLIPDKARTDDLTVTCGGLSYSAGIVTVTSLEVKSGSSSLAKVQSLKIPVFAAKTTV